MNFRELEHVQRPVVVSCTLTLKKPTQVLSPITRNRTTNQCIGQNRMIETNHHTKIENCHTVIILSLRELLKNHVLNLTTMATVNLEINVGTFILSNLTIISNIINRCTLFSQMRALVGSVKDMIESQKHVGPPVAFTGFPSQAQQPYQHVGQGHMVFQVQCSTRWT